MSMRRSLAIILALCAATALQAGTRNFRITGTVVGRHNDPVSSARVTLTYVGSENLDDFPAYPLVVKTAVTGSAGTFDFNGLSAGQYVVTIEHEGYFTYRDKCLLPHESPCRVHAHLKFPRK